MLMRNITLTMELNNESIGQACREVEGFLQEARVEHKNLLRQILILEEILLKYQGVQGQEACFSLQCRQLLHGLRVELSLAGPAFDPFDSGEETDSTVLRNLLAGLGFAPSWRFKDGQNLIIFTPKRQKRSQMFGLGLAIGLALAGGGLCLLLPASVRSFLSVQVLTPIVDSFMGLLSAIAGPMIFLSVAWGIYGIGDAATLGRIGKRMISRFLLLILLISVLVGGAFLPFFTLAESGGSSFRFGELFGIVLDIVPGNFFTPFTEGNPLQIIFVAVLIGMALLLLGNKANSIASLLEQANLTVQLIMGILNSILPLFVFASIFNMVLSNNYAALLQSYKLIPLVLLGSVLVILFYTTLVCVHQRLHPRTLLKKLAPTFLIGLTTASSAAAFATNVETCRNDLGIDEKVVNFGVPLGQVVFMPTTSILFLASSLCMAEVYSVPISPIWLTTALIISIILAVATPPIPGGPLVCFAILFMQLNIPAEALSIVIIPNVLLDFIGTATDIFCLQNELIELSSSLNMIDRERLHSSVQSK